MHQSQVSSVSSSQHDCNSKVFAWMAGVSKHYTDCTVYCNQDNKRTPPPVSSRTNFRAKFLQCKRGTRRLYSVAKRVALETSPRDFAIIYRRIALRWHPSTYSSTPFSRKSASKFVRGGALPYYIGFSIRYHCCCTYWYYQQTPCWAMGDMCTYHMPVKTSRYRLHSSTYCSGRQ